MSNLIRNPQNRFPHDTAQLSPSRGSNQSVQQKIVRSLEFNFGFKKRNFYYPCSKKKDADQLCSNCTDDLHLLFSHKSGFLMTRFNWNVSLLCY